MLNIASVRGWRGELEDGVWWANEGAAVVAQDVARGSAGERAGLLPRDVLLMIDGLEVRRDQDVRDAVHRSTDGRPLVYVVARQSAGQPIAVTLQPMPLTQYGLYFSLAAVGILSIVVGASVRLRRPADQATLHFFWLSVAFFGALAFTRSGRFDRLDYFF